MKTWFVWFLVVSVTMTSASWADEKSIKQEIDSINSRTFAVLRFVAEKQPPFGKYYSAVVYRDKTSNKVYKLAYTEGATGDETGYGVTFCLLEYFDEAGSLIHLRFYEQEGGASESADGSMPNAGPPWEIITKGEIDYEKGAAKDIDSEKTGRSFELKMVQEKNVMPRKVFLDFADFKKVMTEVLSKQLSKENDIPELSLNALEKQQFQSALTKLKQEQFQGSYRLRKPEKGDVTRLVFNQVLLRPKPEKEGKAAGLLNLLDQIKIVAVGKQESIGDWGENTWHQIKKDDSGDKQQGWVFGAFLDFADVAVKD
jgi:hypothetical protein